LPDAFAGRYQIIGKIAQGGMGIVYRAHDASIGRDVAVKVLHERLAGNSAAVRRFLEEARITGQLQHPGIPAVHEIGQLADGQPFLAMKLIKGRTLDNFLAETETGHAAVIPVFVHLCQAVAYAHSHKVIHRDLKPSNVMVGAFGEVQVMDWGLAKVLGDGPDPEPAAEVSSLILPTAADDIHSETQDGTVLGTPAYMPPEQAVGSVDETDERADVFGLGAVLCFLLTRTPPYIAVSGESSLLLAATGKLDAAFARLHACGAEPELIALAKRCLSPIRTDRPRDAGEVAAAVAAFRANAEARARRADLDRVRAEVERAAEAEKATAERKKRRAQLSLAAATVLLVGLGGLERGGRRSRSMNGNNWSQRKRQNAHWRTRNGRPGGRGSRKMLATRSNARPFSAASGCGIRPATSSPRRPDRSTRTTTRPSWLKSRPPSATPNSSHACSTSVWRRPGRTESTTTRTPYRPTRRLFKSTGTTS